MNRPRNRRVNGDEVTHPVDLALLDTAHETGFWGDNGRPAP